VFSGHALLNRVIEFGTARIASYLSLVLASLKTHRVKELTLRKLLRMEMNYVGYDWCV